MGRKPLTVLAVANLKPGFHAVGGAPGLYALVRPTGGRFWILRYQMAGKRRDMGLGSLDLVSLADARERAHELRKMMRVGVDPLQQAGLQRAQVSEEAKLDAWSFKKAAHEVHETLRPGWKNEKHADQWINTLTTYAFPKIGERPVGEIDVAAVLDVLRPIWSAKTETARRVRQRIDAVMRWSVAHGYAASNPVDAAVELLPKQRKAVEHHAAMPYAELPAFLDDLDKRTPSSGSLALRFLILTAARSGEVRGATWGEIDMDAKIWTVPAGRMKADREHRVPLSDAAMKMLMSLMTSAPRIENSALIFPGTKGQPLSDMTLAAVLKRMKIEATPHGFRSSFRDWCAENGVSREMAERALAHAVADKTEAAYNRTDQLEQRRPVMQAWADFVAGKGNSL